MGGVSRTLDRILRGASDAGVRFDELRAVPLHPGFDERVRGSRHVLTRSDVPEILNLQPRGSGAKPYQVKQVRAVLVARGLTRDRDESRWS